ncbi:MAG: hypothetical protein JXR96_25010 [Deltaproteobacteria bacterium]|nr:hypothetical protein [Deltaproteobacteria bacterium]
MSALHGGSLSLLFGVMLELALVACSPKQSEGALPFAPAGPEAAPDPMLPGPFPVGVVTLDYHDESRPDPRTQQARLVRTEIWYPAVQSARLEPSWSYDLKQEANPPIDLGDRREELLAADIPPISSTAVREAEIDRANGPYPLVLFSPGAYSLRFQYLFYTEHLASHGFVVAVPDHAGNTLWDLLRDGQDAEAMGRSVEDRPKDLRLVLNQVEKALANRDSFLYGMVDLAHVAASGHSFGGYTAMAAGCLDTRLGWVISFAPLLRPLSAADCPIESYPLPVMMMGGTDDRTILWEDQACPYLSIAGVEKYLVEIDRAGHFTFCDLCRLGASGISFVNWPDIEQDGCSPTENIPYDEAQKVVVYYATAFANGKLRSSPSSAALLRDRDDGLFVSVDFIIGNDGFDGPDGGCEDAGD